MTVPIALRMTSGLPGGRLVAVLGVGVLLLSVTTYAFAWSPAWVSASSAPIPEWDYQGEHGPPDWDALDPAYSACGRGKQQSPIDLRPIVTSAEGRLHFSYRSSPLSLANDGRVIRGDDLAGSHLFVDGGRYELIHYQFHTPSEHSIDGRRADMELQLMHRDARGRHIIVAVFLQAGRRPNSILRRIAERLPPPGEIYYGGQIGINPLFLLPAERDFYAYPGSLTVPPCTEGVEWLVLRTPVEVDAAWVRRFRQAVGSNARPLQQRNGRPIVYHSARSARP